MLGGIFFLLSVLCFAVFIYPYLIYPIVLSLLPRKAVGKSTCTASVSLLFCAFNEEHALPAKLANLKSLKQRYPQIQILAFDDGSVDETAEILQAETGTLELVRGGGRSGKAAGMKRLAAMATGEILIFTDANVLLDEVAIENLLPYYGDPNVGGVCGTLIYRNGDKSSTAQVGSLYWRLDELLRCLESRTGNVMGGDGSIFSVRKSLYPDFPDTVLDDFTVSMTVIFSGNRLIKAPDVIAFENSVASRKEELRRKVRIGARSYHTHAYLRSSLRHMRPLDRFKYASHKLLRWFGGLFVGLGTVFLIAAAASISALLALALVLVLMTGALIMTQWPSGALAKAGDAFLAIFATLIGVYRGMRGETVATWAPAKSR